MKNEDRYVKYSKREINRYNRKKDRKYDTSAAIIGVIFILVVGFVFFTNNPLAHTVQDKLGMNAYITFSGDKTDAYKNQSSSDSSFINDGTADYGSSRTKLDEFNELDIKQFKQDNAYQIAKLEQEKNGYNSDTPTSPNGGQVYINGKAVNKTCELNNTQSSSNSNVTSNVASTISNQPTTTTPTTQQVAPSVTQPVVDTTMAYDANAYNNASSTASNYSDLVNNFLNEINNIRSGLGLSTLSYSSSLSEMAGYRSYDMAVNKYFSHDKNGVSQLKVAINAFNSTGRHYENLGQARCSQERLVGNVIDGWKGSTCHYEVITKTTVSELGIAIAQDSDGTWYVCTIYR